MITFRSIIVGVVILLMMCGLPIHAPAREGYYHLSIANGLPCNHVYSSICDRQGYLWMATPKGVVRYDGYTTRLFDASSGIGNADVWNLFEDKKGRIWLSSVSDQIGYIYRDKYFKVWLDDSSYVYPIDFVDHVNGVAFISGDKHSITNMCIEKNDSIRTFHLSANISKYNFYFLQSHAGLIIRKNTGETYACKIENFRLKLTKMATHGTQRIKVRGDYLIMDNAGGGRPIECLNVQDRKKVIVPLRKDELLLIAHYYKQQYYFITNKGIYKFDKAMRPVEELSFENLQTVQPGVKADYISIADDSTWGRRLATTNHGLFLRLPNSNMNYETNMPKGKYVGRSADFTIYFRENNTKTLTSITQDGKRRKVIFPSLPESVKIIPYTADTSLMLKNRMLFTLADGVIKPFFQNLDWPHINDCLPDKDGNINTIAGGYGYFAFPRECRDFDNQRIDSGRYNGIAYDSLYNFFILYGNTHLLIRSEGKILKFNYKALGFIGKIENVQINRESGCVFIKTDKRILAYSIRKRKFRYLFSRYNVSDATMYLQGNSIIAAGRFGISYCRILSDMKFSTPITHINVKGEYYNTVTNCFVVGNSVYAETDRGIVSVNLAKKEAGQSDMPKCNLVILSPLQYQAIASGDTIFLNQSDSAPKFDFINPYGLGRVKYAYSVNDAKIEPYLSSEDIVLPKLEVGKYHVLYIKVSDDIWSIPPYKILLYVQPYWWQTQVGKIAISLLLLLGLAIVSGIAIIGTRYALIQKHRRESKFKELELKAIYAQLNPHFIFNTLSNILHFIKRNRNKEAYRYLTTFAKLLRTYIQSSREKWISVADEAENLNNYILLQQSRFNGIFDYRIIIDDDVDSHNTNLPVLLLQPLVENAIHHGLQSNARPGNLLIHFTQTEENMLTIVIDDDGIGRVEAGKRRSNTANLHASYGTDIVRDLIFIFEKYENLQIDIKYVDKTYPETGTTVIVTVNYKYHESI